MFIPSETVAFLPTKNDPDACAVCVKGQPHKGTHREDLPHAMCDAAYGRLKKIVAGERVVRGIMRRRCTGCGKSYCGERKTCETCRERARDQMARKRAGKPLAGESYKCRSPNCRAMLVMPAGKGPAPKWCENCVYRRRLRQNREAKARMKATAPTAA